MPTYKVEIRLRSEHEVQGDEDDSPRTVPELLEVDTVATIEDNKLEAQDRYWELRNRLLD